MFTGQFTSKRKVALGGRSRQEESREQVLQRTRADRERRKQQKLEQKSAASIQAAWRGCKAWREHQDVLRGQWVAAYGTEGERVTRQHLDASSGCVRELLAYFDPLNTDDFKRLRALCQLVLSAQAPDGQLELCRSGEHSGRTLHISRLAGLALRTISSQSQKLKQELSMLETANLQQATDLSVLMGTVMKLTDDASWPSAGLGKLTVLHLADSKRPETALFGCLRRILGSQNPLRSFGELQLKPPTGTACQVLVATLLHRYAQALQSPFQGSYKTKWQRSLSLLAVPLLLQRCPEVSASAPLLWPELVKRLSDIEGDILQWLSPDVDGGRLGSVAALLGNLLEMTPQGLQASDSTGAVNVCRVISSLLSLLPFVAMFPGERSDDFDESAEGPASARVSSVSLQQGPCWEGPLPAPRALREQLELLFRQSVISRIAMQILPDSDGNNGSGANMEVDETSSRQSNSVLVLCHLLRSLLDISTKLGQASPAATRLLTNLAFSAGLVRRLWAMYLKPQQASGEWQASQDELYDPGWMLPLAVLSPVYSCGLSGMESDSRDFPLSPQELYAEAAPKAGLVALLKSTLWQLLWSEQAAPSGGWPAPARGLREELKASGGRLLRQLHDRNVLRRFAPAEAFLAEGLSGERFSAEVGSTLNMRGGYDRASASSSRAWAVLRHAPCLVPFQERAKVFQMLVSADRREVRERQYNARMGPNTFFAIRRNHLIEDGFKALNGLGEGLKEQLRVQFVNQFGEAEAGVDGGGLFKDFLGEIVKTGFDPRYGFFKATTENHLYPNPAAGRVHEAPLAMFEFFGRVLGKSIYEGILLELPLAGFFLKKFQSLGRNDINDLLSLDPELHKQLMFLRTYEGEVLDLCLTFSITDSSMGETREIELVPGGSAIPVTNHNRISYIFFVANHHLNRVISPACAAFLRGVHELIPPEWLRMFNEQELSTLVSGSLEGIDIADLKENVHYAGGYHEDHPVIHSFWKVMQELQPKEQGDFLRFITSCSRPPLLGFKYLEPQLCIQMAGSVLDPNAGGRLPTASTCMNLLKMPPYQSQEVLREKLLYAISSGAGFDLS